MARFFRGEDVNLAQQETGRDELVERFRTALLESADSNFGYMGNDYRWGRLVVPGNEPKGYAMVRRTIHMVEGLRQDETAILAVQIDLSKPGQEIRVGAGFNRQDQYFSLRDEQKAIDYAAAYVRNYSLERDDPQDYRYGAGDVINATFLQK